AVLYQGAAGQHAQPEAQVQCVFVAGPTFAIGVRGPGRAAAIGISHVRILFSSAGTKVAGECPHSLSIDDSLRLDVRQEISNYLRSANTASAIRSEEHTSELQSREKLVC